MVPKPELRTIGSNQVWSWDITKLMGLQKWTYYYLYVPLDIFSRYVLGWLIAERESLGLAKPMWRPLAVSAAYRCLDKQT
jgi:putative transposase